MKKSDNINRRRFLQSSIIGSAALVGGSSLFLSARCDGREQKPAGSDFAADIEIGLTAAPDDAVQNLDNIYLGQVLRLQSGQKESSEINQVIPADWVKESTRDHSDTTLNSGYGYLR